MVEFEMRINPARAVPAIKAIRFAFQLGLKEAKDVFDRIRTDYPVTNSMRVRTSFEKLGRITAELARDNDAAVFITNIVVVHPEEAPLYL